MSDYYDNPAELFDNGDARETLLDGYLRPMLNDSSVDTDIKNHIQTIVKSEQLQDELIDVIKNHLNDSVALNNYVADYDAYELGNMDSPWNTVIDITEDTIEDFIKYRFTEPSTLSEEFAEYDNLWDF